MFLWSSSIQIISRIMDGAAGGVRAVGWGWGAGRLTSDPADRLIVSAAVTFIPVSKRAWGWAGEKSRRQ